jgi:hypothetical protein
MTSDSRKPARVDRNDVVSVLVLLGDSFSVAVVWRRRAPGSWAYVGRFPRAALGDDPSDLLETLRLKYGGGHYRAKLYGPWDRRTRRERFLCQVTFGIWGPGVDG